MCVDTRKVNPWAPTDTWGVQLPPLMGNRNCSRTPLKNSVYTKFLWVLNFTCTQCAVSSSKEPLTEMQRIQKVISALDAQLPNHWLQLIWELWCVLAEILTGHSWKTSQCLGWSGSYQFHPAAPGLVEAAHPWRGEKPLRVLRQKKKFLVN